SDFRGARQRNHADEPAAPGAQRALQRRLDSRAHWRDRHSRHAQAVLRAGTIARRDRLGPDLRPPWITTPSRTGDSTTYITTTTKKTPCCTPWASAWGTTRSTPGNCATYTNRACRPFRRKPPCWATPASG